MSVRLQSFGYRYGKPNDECVISVRHFANPVRSARKFDGRSARLQKEVYKENMEAFSELRDLVQSKINEALAQYQLAVIMGNIVLWP